MELKSVKNLEVFRCNLRRLVLLEMIRDDLALRRQFGIGEEQAHELCGQIDWVTSAKQGSGRSNGFGESAAVRTQNEATRGGAFQSDYTKGLLVHGGDDQYLMATQFPGDAVLVERSEESHLRIQTRSGGKVLKRGPFWSIANDGQPSCIPGRL
jgi:hypothetical protein